MISIIVPVYNCERYIERCLASLKKQTYKNIEVIIVNDGSTDRSGEICNDYCKDDSRFRVYNINNSGVSVARNYGIDRATGDYITFVDSDDYVDIDYISFLYSKIKKTNVDIVLSRGKDFDDFNQYVICNDSFDNDLVLNSNDIISRVLEEKIINGVCWGNLYKSSVCKKISFDSNMKISEDMKFLIDYLERVSKGVIAFERKYNYYVRSDSAIHSGFNSNFYDEIIYCELLIKKYYNTDLYQYAIKRYTRILLTCLVMKDLDNNNNKILIKKLLHILPYAIINNKIKFKTKIRIFFIIFRRLLKI